MYPYQPFQQFQQYQTPQFTTLQQQQVPKANGKASIDAMRLAPNSSVLVMDTTAPIVWLCVSDSLGNVSSTPYDIAVHQEAPPVDMGSIEQRLANVENAIKKWEVNHEPDARNAEPRQNERSSRTDTAHQTGNGYGEVGKQPIRYASANAGSES